MISFANPTWLYGLFGLIVPIAIHLLSRKEGKTVYIGSIRHLTDSDTAQFSSIRLNEILLLMLRLLLITVLVLILAGSDIALKNNESRKWLVLEKGTEKSEEFKRISEDVRGNGFEIHWLAESLPAYADSSGLMPVENYSRLIYQLDALTDSAVVLSYNFSRAFKGEKLSLPKQIQWVAVEPSELHVAISASIRGDSVSARVAHSTPVGTSLTYERISQRDWQQMKRIDSLITNSLDTMLVTIFFDKDFEYDRKIVQAALGALSETYPEEIEVRITGDTSSIDNQSDFLFWLSTEPCQLQQSKVIGYFSCDSENLPLIIVTDDVPGCNPTSTFDWLITKRLDEESALGGSLAVSIGKIISQDLPIRRNVNPEAYDQRSLPSDLVFTDTKSHQTGIRNNKVEAQTEPVLYYLLLLILLAERIIAYRRNQ